MWRVWVRVVRNRSCALPVCLREVTRQLSRCRYLNEGGVYDAEIADNCGPRHPPEATREHPFSLVVAREMQFLVYLSLLLSISYLLPK